MLPQHELDDLRDELIVQVMPDTCYILSRTLSVDTMGAPVETWGTASYNVACRLDHTKGNEVISGGAIQPYYAYMLTVPFGTSITSLNRVKHDSITYSVKSVSSGSYVACLRCELEKIG
jgi:hypothetical protein